MIVCMVLFAPFIFFLVIYSSSLGSYQYNWSIYLDTSQSAVIQQFFGKLPVLLVHLSWHQPVSCNANIQFWAPRRESHYYHLKSLWFDQVRDRTHNLSHLSLTPLRPLVTMNITFENRKYLCKLKSFYQIGFCTSIHHSHCRFNTCNTKQKT